MRLIDADALMQTIIEHDYPLVDAFNSNGFGMFTIGIEQAINEQPTIEAEPVRHGRWDSVKNPQWPAYSHDKCSICGWWNTKNALCYDGNRKPGHSLNYCPNCGAKMDGGCDK